MPEKLEERLTKRRKKKGCPAGTLSLSRDHIVVGDALEDGNNSVVLVPTVRETRSRKKARLHLKYHQKGE